MSKVLSIALTVVAFCQLANARVGRTSNGGPNVTGKYALYSKKKYLENCVQIDDRLQTKLGRMKFCTEARDEFSPSRHLLETCKNDEDSYFVFADLSDCEDAGRELLEEFRPRTPPSEQDQKILAEGKITGGTFGTAPEFAGIYLGFGIGHVLQGRWSERGWIFTSGEIATLAIAIGGLSGCSSQNAGACSQAAWAGGGFLGFKVWEVVDIFYAEYRHNERLQELQEEGYRPTKLNAILAPLRGGLSLDLAYQF